MKYLSLISPQGRRWLILILIMLSPLFWKGAGAFAQSVSPAMVKYVEDYLGFHVTTIEPDNGISISNVLPSTKISRIMHQGPKVQEGLILTAILPNGRGSIKDFRHIINKENFVRILMEFKKNGYKKPWLFTKITGNDGMYKIDMSDLNVDELIKLSALAPPTITKSSDTKETTITDGKLNGVKKEYYASGKLKNETSWMENQMNGLQKTYFESGNLKQETPWVSNQINGIQKTYYESGQLKKETPYTDNIISGAIKQYDESGNFKEETPTQDNTQQTTKTEESVYRGSADPLKGLNVSKPKEIATGNYYALIIGIDKYSGTWKPLNTAVHDAQAFESVLRTKYRIDKFYTLYDAQATRSAIENALDNLVNTMKENDNVVIYYSGHGDFKKTMNKGYWIPVDAKTNATSDLISNNDIQSFLDAIKSKHTLLIADACFSGDIFRGNTLTEPFEESDKYYSKVYNLMSRQALTSGGIEPVMDGGKDGHSVFAYYLLKNLANNANKYLDVGTLYNKLKIPVVNNSDQTPHLDPIKNTGDEGGQFIFIKK